MNMSTLNERLHKIGKVRQRNAPSLGPRKTKMTEKRRCFNNMKDAARHRLRKVNLSESEKFLLKQTEADRQRKCTDENKSFEECGDADRINFREKDEQISRRMEKSEFENENYSVSAAELCVAEVTEYDDSRLGFSNKSYTQDEENNEATKTKEDEEMKEDMSEENGMKLEDPITVIIPEAKIKAEVSEEEVQIKKEQPDEMSGAENLNNEPSLDSHADGSGNIYENFNHNINNIHCDQNNLPDVLPLSVQISENDSRYLSCDVCNYRTIKTTALKRHMWIHTGRKIYECTVCDYKTIESSTFKRHMMTHTGEKPYACSFCEYKTTQSCNFKRHMMTHNKTAPTYDCELCDFKTDRSTLFAKHMSIHTNQKPYGCNLCHYRTTQRSRVKRHMLTHTGEKSFSCNLCTYKTAQFSNFKRHMLTHTKEKLFSCDLCNYKTTQSSNVKRHMIIHKEMKINSCDQCDFKTIHVAAFKAHMSTHGSNKDKIYTCSFCNYITLNANALKVHMMLHTGEKPYTCNHCDYKTAQCSNIRRHLLKHITDKKSLAIVQSELDSSELSASDDHKLLNVPNEHRISPSSDPLSLNDYANSNQPQH